MVVSRTGSVGPDSDEEYRVREFVRAVIVCALAVLVSASPSGAFPLASLGGAPVTVQVGEDLSPRVRSRILRHFGAMGGDAVRVLEAEVVPGELAAGELLVSLGETATSRALAAPASAARLGREGFLLESHALGEGTALVARAAIADGSLIARRAAHYAAYAALEELGAGFLHPLAPTLPGAIRDPRRDLARREQPYWGHRVLHLHTMHPLETTHVANGWGPGGPGDAAGWEALLPEWEALLEWCLANRQNVVEWVLLEHRSWADFSTSPTRQARLKRLVDLCHEYGLLASIDVPMGLAQQNGFRLVTRAGTVEEELAQMRERLDWLLAAGFDEVGTEQGFSEFHSPDAQRSLAWMNGFTEHVAGAHGKHPWVKVHVSVGEIAEGFRDPDTGEELNINYLPHFADERLGVLVHTVQHYALDDPAPTYGREDFSDLRRFLGLTAGSRPTLWYPETAYWVSFDIDVPLFLPVYAERRVHDLRLIARDEVEGRLGRGAAAGSRMDGQIIFSSGWEWGYWLNDVVTARAAWDPRVELATDEAAFRDILAEALAVFGGARDQVVDLVVRTAQVQHELLIRGHHQTALVGEIPPRDAEIGGDEAWLHEEPLAGQSYLQGVETWDDVNDLVDRIPFFRSISHQPFRLGPVSVRGRKASRQYERRIRPMLGQMDSAFGALAAGFEGAAGGVPDAARPLADEFADAARITQLRVHQLHALYDKASRYRKDDAAWKAARLAEAAATLDAAAQVVARREHGYRADPERLAGWGLPNATSYPWGYLWPVRSLYYWWRDEGKVRQVPRSPCYMNVIHGAEVASAEGVEGNLYKTVNWMVRNLGFPMSWARECLHPPDAAPDLAGRVRP